eukprot:Skav209217  [mRNA]  locus=scaffold603:13551:14422:+ [translate_table: standard]
MVVSAVQAAKRALVTLLLTLAKLYAVSLTITRDADNDLVEAAFRKVVKRTHPDKGGKLEDQQRLQAARAKWQSLLQEKNPKPRSRAKNQKKQHVLPIQGSGNAGAAKPFLIRSTAVLLTYHNIPESAWGAFLQFLAKHLVPWQVLHWCASMERCASGAPHVHVMLQFAGPGEMARNFVETKENQLKRLRAPIVLDSGWCSVKKPQFAGLPRYGKPTGF